MISIMTLLLGGARFVDGCTCPSLPRSRQLDRDPVGNGEGDRSIRDGFSP